VKLRFQKMYVIFANISVFCCYSEISPANPATLPNEKTRQNLQGGYPLGVHDGGTNFKPCKHPRFSPNELLHLNAA